jgi:hypothetical protein
MQNVENISIFPTENLDMKNYRTHNFAWWYLRSMVFHLFCHKRVVQFQGMPKSRRMIFWNFSLLHMPKTLAEYFEINTARIQVY